LPPVSVDGAIVFAPAGEIVPAALRAVRSGATVACAGITMSAIPAMSYEECLFHEKKLRSVEANTRADGEGLLREAAEIPIRPSVTTFALADANDALVALKEDRINGSGVLCRRLTARLHRARECRNKILACSNIAVQRGACPPKPQEEPP